MRIGHGYDVHLFAEGRRLVLGGVEIPCEKGLLGHSDADVLLHAVMDALLGAAGLGDIGKHFPDSDEQYKDISSLALLDKTVKLIEQSGFSVENIDCTVVMLAPKIAPYTEEMKNNIASHCHIMPQQVNIKATTEEGAGLGEAAAGAHAVCLLNGGGTLFGALFT
ncbi:MAG: 2-C-methyl-D-erythritol 2,4-cyclodiphosphate synthase [Oscillospiraceae bacterium]|nr:2-C-methyl-D-erythritol 2,4-cyclodiphosphate synthase [Oscillospiraceae bacterium]